MKIKSVILGSFLLISSAAVIAGGSHGGGHDKGKGHAMSPVGKPIKYNSSFKTVNVTTGDDMRFVFNPALSSIQSGENINFVVKNIGKIAHEFSIGNQMEQKGHAKMMQKMPGMKHEDGNTVSLESGEEKTLSWQFLGKDEVVFACNIPGHYEAGMFHKSPISGGEKTMSHEKMKVHSH